jgi:hypothetical protein
MKSKLECELIFPQLDTVVDEETVASMQDVYSRGLCAGRVAFGNDASAMLSIAHEGN